ncbi:hypothetical protein ACTXMZ_16145 [Brachybacterium alimentarium]|uniref:Cap15 family cyclic dinucleotide receptor domain-containing protein n=1 Tax=Brachybacterium alimentarium TaxID=47845 RepID=UPI003FD3AFB3
MMARPTMAVRTTALLVSLAYSVIVFLSGVQMPDAARWIVSALPTVAVTSLVAWDLVLWRLPILQSLTRRPDIRGFWRVKLTPHRDSNIPPEGNRGPIDGFLEVRQSYWSIYVRLYTAESSSTSTASTWLPTFETEVDNLNYLYLNTPKVEVSDRSARSTGAASFEPASLKPTEVAGRYFSDRATRGDVLCTFVDRRVGHATFGAASRYADQVSPRCEQDV